MTQSKGETVALSTASVLYVLGLGWIVKDAGWSGIHLNEYPVFLPTALLAVSFANHWLRSKIAGWSLFTLSFICFMAVLGAFVIRMRVLPDLQWLFFARAMALYLALGMAGLYQLRGQKH